ncbi:hypothetical protein IEQ34_011921 [Dendrobium chrysotoxum]|uniref:Uncharacterized protein n=1 Tax=Dendrobium chrysotoxum TaxID=161865 RepID=A0AAV7GU90_DENCH|nr:hypothetical protein IEQ34_011921 [Dendrobium chrysotoxum]
MASAASFDQDGELQVEHSAQERGPALSSFTKGEEVPSMRTVFPLGLSPSPSPRPSPSSSSIAANTPIRSVPKSLARVKLFQKCGRGVLPPQLSDTGINSRAGTCRASQTVDLFPSICPEIVVRDARVEDCWEVADTHLPPCSRRTCLVAVTGNL